MLKLENFFDKEYIKFAAYDNSRKISNIVDGFKISQRKVFYTLVKNNIDSDKKELKVEQLAAKASEQTSYLHGATSLNGVSVGLAQKYTGSNNINLLEPDGNFGSRFLNEASASRYIYTYISDITKYIFKKEDEPILKEQTFEGQVIEPVNYYPIIPMVLVNGSEGLSVGFSSNIQPRDPKQIITWLEYKLQGKKYKKDFIPYYKGYTGTIERDINSDKVKYISKGDYIQNTNHLLTITEIPIKYNLKSYIKVLDTLCDKGIIKSYKDYSDNDIFKFEVKVDGNFFKDKTKDDILQQLKLVETIQDNLVLLDRDGKIQEYSSIEEILEDYYDIRYDIYRKRKEYYISKLNNDLIYYQEKAKFINLVINKKVKIDGSINDIINKLTELKIHTFNDTYDYLLDIKISSFTQEKVNELNNKINNINKEIDILNNSTIEDMWLNELKLLKSKL